MILSHDFIGASERFLLDTQERIMRKFVKIAFVATNAVIIMAGAAYARDDYRNTERQVTARDFQAQYYRYGQPSRLPTPGVPEHGPAYDQVGAP